MIKMNESDQKSLNSSNSKLREQPGGSNQEIFQRYYAKLCEILPVEQILPYLVTKGVISFEDEEEIMAQATSWLKVRALLMPIRKALFADITDPFWILLRIMQSSQHLAGTQLAADIIAEMTSETGDGTSRELLNSETT